MTTCASSAGRASEHMSDPHCRCKWYWWSPQKESWYDTNGGWWKAPFRCCYCGTHCAPGGRTRGVIIGALALLFDFDWMTSR